jgi:hypothetical protein
VVIGVSLTGGDSPGTDKPAFNNRGDPPLLIQNAMTMRSGYVDDDPDQPPSGGSSDRKSRMLRHCQARLREVQSAPNSGRASPSMGAPIPSTTSAVGAN